MAAGEEDIGQWAPQISRVPIPVVRWRSGRQWLLLLASIVFLAAVFLCRNRYLPALGDTALQIGNEMQKLGEKVQVLKQEQIVPPEKAQVLEKDLDRIRQEALGKDPAKTMEAIDHLEQSFNKSAAEAAESAIQQTEAASRCQELAQALADAQGKMDPKQLSEAMKELGQMTEEAAAENKSLADALSDELQKASQSGDFTAEQLKELSKSLEKCKAGERGKIEKMVQAKLVDAEMLAECDKAAAGDEAVAVGRLGRGRRQRRWQRQQAACRRVDDECRQGWARRRATGRHDMVGGRRGKKAPRSRKKCCHRRPFPRSRRAGWRELVRAIRQRRKQAAAHPGAPRRGPGRRAPARPNHSA